MGDRTWAKIYFTIPNPMPDELEQAVAEECFSDIDAGGVIISRFPGNVLLVPGAAFEASRDEVNYGNFGLEDFLMDHEIPFKTLWAAGGSYGPGYAFWFPGMSEKYEGYTDENGEEIVSASRIRLLAAEHDDPQAALTAILDYVNESARVVPELPTPTVSTFEADALIDAVRAPAKEATS